MHQMLIGIGFGVAFATSFAAVAFLTPPEPPQAIGEGSGAPSGGGKHFAELYFDAASVGKSQLGDGWAQPNTWGAWQKANATTLRLPVEQAVEGGLDVTFFLRGAKAEVEKPTTVLVDHEGKRIGQVVVPPGARDFGQRVVVPASAIDGEGVELLLRVSGPNRGPQSFGLERIELAHLGDGQRLRGHLDKCNRELVRGWAVRGRIGVPVSIRVNDKHVAFVPAWRERKDLRRKQLPQHAGFAYRFREPLNADDRITVAFPNGEALEGKDCK